MILYATRKSLQTKRRNYETSSLKSQYNIGRAQVDLNKMTITLAEKIKKINNRKRTIARAHPKIILAMPLIFGI